MFHLRPFDCSKAEELKAITWPWRDQSLSLWEIRQRDSDWPPQLCNSCQAGPPRGRTHTHTGLFPSSADLDPHLTAFLTQFTACALNILWSACTTTLQKHNSHAGWQKRCICGSKREIQAWREMITCASPTVDRVVSNKWNQCTSVFCTIFSAAVERKVQGFHHFCFIEQNVHTCS